MVQTAHGYDRPSLKAWLLVKALTCSSLAATAPPGNGGSNSLDRKLATIMVGDYVGSTGAMERNEETALSQVMAGLDLVSR